jgi:hypothetical protein
MMQFSQRSAFRPLALVDSMLLQHGVQQDTQEFSKLFLDRVEIALKVRAEVFFTDSSTRCQLIK